MTGVCIFGANSLARMLIELIRKDGGLVNCVVVDDEHWTSPTFHGTPLVRYTAIDRGAQFLSALGYRRMRSRRTVFERLERDGHEVVNFVSSSASVWPGSIIGAGNVVMPGVVVEPFARIGSGNLFWTGTIVCHEVSVGHHNYISAGCILGGHSQVGDLCFLGNSSTTIDGVALADETHLLPGSVVFESTAPHTKYFGTPARAIGLHQGTGIVVER